MSPACAQQALAALELISSEKGTERLERLKENSNFFRKSLEDMGFVTYGDQDSPIVIIMMFHPAKFLVFSRELLKRGVILQLWN
jgi:serine palmitoyltransferase